MFGSDCHAARMNCREVRRYEKFGCTALAAVAKKNLRVNFPEINRSR
jgi:hypothetical protein